MKQKLSRKLSLNKRTVHYLAGGAPLNIQGGEFTTACITYTCTQNTCAPVCPSDPGMSPQSKCVGATASCCAGMCQ